MELVDKDVLIAKIEELKARFIALHHKDGMDWPLDNYGKMRAYNEVLSIINTLEVKEVDLEKKATQLSQKYFPDEENIWARPNIEAQNCKSACIEMVEWLKAQKGE